MRRDGSLEQDSDLKDFSLGFTQGPTSFDFVDVGYAKERADMKIKGEPQTASVRLRFERPRSTDENPAEATKWHLRNVNCKQIVLGISHDSGYAPFLDEILRNEETRRRISILEVGRLSLPNSPVPSLLDPRCERRRVKSTWLADRMGKGLSHRP